MQVLFDVNIVVDICAQRAPYYDDALRIEGWCRDKGTAIRLYTGSVQTMLYVLAGALAEHDRNSTGLRESRGFYEREAARLLEIYTDDLSWVSALSEDGMGFGAEDPEDAQLEKAVQRLGPEAHLITRDLRLLNRCGQALSPGEFVDRYIEAKAFEKPPMPFCDLAAQLDTFRPEMEREILDVVESASYIKGPPLGRLEQELSDYLDGGETEAIGCASGTDALLIALMALGVKPGDEIIIPDFTFIATGEVIAFLGAVPVFCDVDPVTYNMDPAKIEGLMTEKTVGLIPVSIFGQPADFDSINPMAQKHGLWVMEDGAQSFGARYKGRKSGTLTDIATTSFFPAKPLGCYGDGGAVFTRDKALADRIRIILNHGQVKRYHHATVGVNGRLDSLQAAVLSVKLRHFDEEAAARRKAAEAYTALLQGRVQTPVVRDGNQSVWAQYTVQHDDRQAIRERLQAKGIPTAVHYPIPLHKQEAFSYLDGAAETPVTEALAQRVFSLPMHPFLKDGEIQRVCEALIEAVHD